MIGHYRTNFLFQALRLLFAALLLLVLSPHVAAGMADSGAESSTQATEAMESDTVAPVSGGSIDTQLLHLLGRLLSPAARPEFPPAVSVSAAADEPVHYSNNAIVLLYHHLDYLESDVTITPEKFRQHMQALKDNHYHVVSMADFAGFLEGKNSLPPNAVVITFDDGYESFYTYAYPVLKQMGFPATVFTIVSYIGTVNNGLPFLTWTEMQKMEQDGFSFLSHTYNLHTLTPNENGVPVSPLANPVRLSGGTETSEEHERNVKADLTEASLLLRYRLGETLPMLSLPHGEYNESLLGLTEQLGIRFIVTTDPGINQPGDTMIKRVNVGMPYVTSNELLLKLKAYDEN